LVVKMGVIGAGVGGKGMRDPPMVAVEVGGRWKMMNKATNES
jgi:hypothetical protein